MHDEMSLLRHEREQGHRLPSHGRMRFHPPGVGECLSCGKRFTTYETVERLPLMVIKKDGSRQSFDKEKVLRGMLRACEKRPVPVDTLMRLADEIEQEVQNSLEREISSRKIGELVMDRLKGVDEVAYVRFASVYRQFKDINTFMTELNKLLAERT